MLIKGSIQQDFRPPCFFHDSNPSRPLINRLKYFRIGFRFRRDIQIFKKHWCASFRESDSSVCIKGCSQVPKISEKPLRCASHWGVKLCGVHHTAESSSAVCITPRSQTAHRRVRIENFEDLWLLLKGESGEILLGVNTYIMKEKIWKEKMIEYLGEIKTESENILACLSGAQMGSNLGKKWRSKISWHTPFKRSN